MHRFIDHYFGSRPHGPESAVSDPGLLWAGRKWGVARDGVRMVRGGVTISTDRLLDRDPASGRLKWPEFIAAKWPDHEPTDFMTAWLVALALLQPVQGGAQGRCQSARGDEVQAAIERALAWIEGER